MTIPETTITDPGCTPAAISDVEQLVPSEPEQEQERKLRQRTLALIKPDAMAANHKQDIIDRITLAGFSIIQQKQVHLSLAQTRSFYREHENKTFYPELTEWMSSVPIYALVLEKENAIQDWRNLMGPTNAIKAREIEPDSIRALFGTDGSKNATHGSDCLTSAEREIDIVFGSQNESSSVKTAAYLDQIETQSCDNSFAKDTVTASDHVATITATATSTASSSAEALATINTTNITAITTTATNANANTGANTSANTNLVMATHLDKGNIKDQSVEGKEHQVEVDDDTPCITIEPTTASATLETLVERSVTNDMEQPVTTASDHSSADHDNAHNNIFVEFSLEDSKTEVTISSEKGREQAIDENAASETNNKNAIEERSDEDDNHYKLETKMATMTVVEAQEMLTWNSEKKKNNDIVQPESLVTRDEHDTQEYASDVTAALDDISAIGATIPASTVNVGVLLANNQDNALGTTSSENQFSFDEDHQEPVTVSQEEAVPRAIVTMGTNAREIIKDEVQAKKTAETDTSVMMTDKEADDSTSSTDNNIVNINTEFQEQCTTIGEKKHFTNHVTIIGETKEAEKDEKSDAEKEAASLLIPEADETAVTTVTSVAAMPNTTEIFDDQQQQPQTGKEEKEEGNDGEQNVDIPQQGEHGHVDHTAASIIETYDQEPPALTESMQSTVVQSDISDNDEYNDDDESHIDSKDSVLTNEIHLKQDTGRNEQLLVEQSDDESKNNITVTQPTGNTYHVETGEAAQSVYDTFTNAKETEGIQHKMDETTTAAAALLQEAQLAQRIDAVATDVNGSEALQILNETGTITNEKASTENVDRLVNLTQESKSVNEKMEQVETAADTSDLITVTIVDTENETVEQNNVKSSEEIAPVVTRTSTNDSSNPENIEEAAMYTNTEAISEVTTASNDTLSNFVVAETAPKASIDTPALAPDETPEAVNDESLAAHTAELESKRIVQISDDESATGNKLEEFTTNQVKTDSEKLAAVEVEPLKNELLANEETRDIQFGETSTHEQVEATKVGQLGKVIPKEKKESSATKPTCPTRSPQRKSASGTLKPTAKSTSPSAIATKKPSTVTPTGSVKTTGTTASRLRRPAATSNPGNTVTTATPNEKPVKKPAAKSSASPGRNPLPRVATLAKKPAKLEDSAAVDDGKPNATKKRSSAISRLTAPTAASANKRTSDVHLTATGNVPSTAATRVRAVSATAAGHHTLGTARRTATEATVTAAAGSLTGKVSSSAATNKPAVRRSIPSRTEDKITSATGTTTASSRRTSPPGSTTVSKPARSSAKPSSRVTPTITKSPPVHSTTAAKRTPIRRNSPPTSTQLPSAVKHTPKTSKAASSTIATSDKKSEVKRKQVKTVVTAKKTSSSREDHEETENKPNAKDNEDAHVESVQHDEKTNVEESHVDTANNRENSKSDEEKTVDNGSMDDDSKEDTLENEQHSDNHSELSKDLHEGERNIATEEEAVDAEVKAVVGNHENATITTVTDTVIETTTVATATITNTNTATSPNDPTAPSTLKPITPEPNQRPKTPEVAQLLSKFETLQTSSITPTRSSNKAAAAPHNIKDLISRFN